MPGQRYPGLGIGHEVLELMILMAERLGKAGLANRPDHFHNARFYHEEFKFLDPVAEGRFIAMARDTAEADLTDVSWAVHLGCLEDSKASTFVRWEGLDQVFPMSTALRRRFEDPAYRRAVWMSAAAERYAVDWERYRRKVSGCRP